jgi:hypothetical protein
MGFSEREGYKKIKEIQIESIDNELKNGIWNLIWKIYFRSVGADVLYEEAVRDFFEPVWENHFKLPMDVKSSLRFDVSFERYLDEFKEAYFNKENKWYELYDLIEFIATKTSNRDMNQRFILECNKLLESEMAAYRFVDGRICTITSKEEIKEVEKALNSPFQAVNSHIQNALDLYADKVNPSYRNSIKESISAVEAMCRLIVKDEPTLGKALKQIETQGTIIIPHALKEAFAKLYGYTSSSQAIRHSLGLTEEPNVKQDDARFFLIACSAFVNYLATKALEAGIKFGNT